MFGLFFLGQGQCFCLLTLTKIASNQLKKKNASNWLENKAKSKVITWLKTLKKAKSNQTYADQPCGHTYAQPCHQGNVAASAFPTMPWR